LGFYLWYATDKRNIEIEKKYFWIFSCIVWCFTVCYNVFSFADGYVNENFGIRVTPLLCKPPNSNLHIITYSIIIPLLFCISLIFNFNKFLFYNKFIFNFIIIILFINFI